MRTLHRKLKLSYVIAALLLPTLSQAGGLWINEYGSPVMGRAGAGAEAGTDDASASLHNIASMTRVEGEQLMVSGGVIYSKIHFDVKDSGVIAGDGDGGDAGGLAPGAGIFYTRPINEQWSFGTYFGALTGSALDYDNDWAGRYQSQEVTLVGLALMPSVAYKVNDELSVGLGLPIMYTELELKVAIPQGIAVPDEQAKIDGDDTIVAINLSALYEFTPQTRLGITYNSEFDAKYSGTASSTARPNDIDIDTKLALAAKIYTGLTHELNDRMSAHLTIGWENWSEMDNVNLSTQSNGAALPRNWEDTYHYAIGMKYLLAEDWIINAGLAYDTSPVDKKDRTADMPLDRQIRYAIGLEHELASGTSIAAQMVYADYGEGKIEAGGLINPDGPTRFSGEYSDNDLLFFSVSANWAFGE